MEINLGGHGHQKPRINEDATHLDRKSHGFLTDLWFLSMMATKFLVRICLQRHYVRNVNISSAPSLR
jgi:hypothetical protein